MKVNISNQEVTDSTMEITGVNTQVDHGDRGDKNQVSNDLSEIMEDPEMVEEHLDLKAKE